MKAVIIFTILITLAIIFFQYSKNKNFKKLLISLGTFAAIILFVVLGNLTRQIIPLFMAHVILIFLAWGGLIVYIVKNRYYWWIIFLPLVTIGLFLVLELLVGSGHEGVLPQR